MVKVITNAKSNYFKEITTTTTIVIIIMIMYLAEIKR